MKPAKRPKVAKRTTIKRTTRTRPILFRLIGEAIRFLIVARRYLDKQIEPPKPIVWESRQNLCRRCERLLSVRTIGGFTYDPRYNEDNPYVKEKTDV